MEGVRVPWYRVDLGSAAQAAVAEALRAHRVTMGPLTERLEAGLAARLGIPYVIATSSGAAALAVALWAAGVEPGDEVIVPGLSFIATAHAVQLLGARVRLADVAADRPLLDVGCLDALRGPRTRAVIPVHLGGRAVDMAPLLTWAEAHGLAVIEDAAQALGSRGPLGLLGTLGRAGVYSASITKALPMGEGGFVVTHDADLAARARRLRNHGSERLADNRFASFGFHFRPTDLAAALGLVALDLLDERLAAALDTWRAYEAALADRAGIDLLPLDREAGEIPCWTEALAGDRAGVLADLARAGLEGRAWPPPLCESPHLDPAARCPNARAFAARAVVLPSGPDQAADVPARVRAALG